MRIDSVNAKAFGPLHNRTLELQPGLNVVVGRNESAKSTWHAAIYAAICGRARGRGAQRREDREFAEQYRPWVGDSWFVSAELSLDDGRRIEIHHELIQAVDCKAVDLELGRDCSDEILYAGTPDGSRWLGMNRSVFAATACVRQSEILAVLQDADGLQRQIQAAATHAGSSDPTAAQAIALLDDFKSEHVGLDRVNSTKPLRQAKQALEKAMRDLETAKDQHASYLTLVGEAEARHADAERLASQVQAANARIAAFKRLIAYAQQSDAAHEAAKRLQDEYTTVANTADSLAERLSQAIVLDADLGGREPAGDHTEQQVVAAVAGAIAGWTARPQLPALQGPTAEGLRQRLDGLPSPPTGDLSPDPTVVAAAQALENAEAILQETDRHRPDEAGELTAELSAARVVGASTLRDWAARLDSIETVDEGELEALRSEADAAQQELDEAQLTATRADVHYEESLQSGQPTSSKPRNRSAVVAAASIAAVAAIASIGLFVSGNAVAGAGLAAICLVSAMAALLAGRSAAGGPSAVAPAPDSRESLRKARDSAREQARMAEQKLFDKRAHVRQLENDARDAKTDLDDMTAKCAANGLPPDSQQLRVIATRLDQFQQSRQAAQQWEDRRRQNQEAVRTAESELGKALLSRGVESSDVRRAHQDYVQNCGRHAAQARLSAQRQSLEEALAARLNEDKRATDAENEAVAAAQRLDEVASQAGLMLGAVTVETADDAVAALQTWQRERVDKARELDERRAKWTELQTLLNGLTLPQLRERAESTRTQANELEGQVAEAQSLAEERSASLLDQAQESAVEILDPRSATPDLTDMLSRAEADAGPLREAAEQAQNLAYEARGRRDDRAKLLPSVAEAEEEVDRREAELIRVKALETTLAVTRSHLLNAQETVHRSIAPTLQRTLVEWLPTVTDGRYTDAIVDPETLGVRVRAGTGSWVPAQQLSVGTAEQIYLLLRVALVTHIADPETSCPLFLDDVTVQADERRTKALLDVLLALSADRQIVLFAQEPLVQKWAEAQIDDGRPVHLITLEQVPV